MILYCSAGEEAYPVSTLSETPNACYSEVLEFTDEEASFVTKAFDNYDKAQRMIDEKLKVARERVVLSSDICTCSHPLSSHVANGECHELILGGVCECEWYIWSGRTS